MNMQNAIRPALFILGLALAPHAAYAERTVQSFGHCFELYDLTSRFADEAPMKTYASSASGRVLEKGVQLWGLSYDQIMKASAKAHVHILGGLMTGRVDLVQSLDACDAEWSDALTGMPSPRPATFNTAAATARATEKFRTDNALTCTVAYMIDGSDANSARQAVSTEFATYTGARWATLNGESNQTVKDQLIRQEYERVSEALSSGEESLPVLVSECDANWSGEIAAAREAQAARDADEAARKLAAENARKAYDPNACTRIENAGIAYLNDMAATRRAVEQDGSIDRDEYLWRAGNIVRHLRELADEADRKHCRQIAEDMRYVIET